MKTAVITLFLIFSAAVQADNFCPTMANTTYFMAMNDTMGLSPQQNVARVVAMKKLHALDYVTRDTLLRLAVAIHDSGEAVAISSDDGAQLTIGCSLPRRTTQPESGH